MVTVALARTNIYLKAVAEPRLRELSTVMELIALERSEHAVRRDTLPQGFILPLDSVVALCGGKTEEGATTLMRFAGKDDVFRVDELTDAGPGRGMSRVLRAGHAILIEKEAWRRLLAQSPSAMETVADFVAGRNALPMVNATCYSNHRYAKRLARLLIEARAAYPVEDERMQLSHQDIADLMNTRRETITLGCATLADAGIIESVRGRIRILDAPALRERSCACVDRVREIAASQLGIAGRLVERIFGKGACRVDPARLTDRPHRSGSARRRAGS